ncbi:hypothetical protein [Streptomyces sp. NPDC058401]|uniref:hypothetical protein n=1 Tax=Streptomyces sp. NPDC058401 TaxID=3346480 RepID=UPI00365ADE31
MRFARTTPHRRPRPHLLAALFLPGGLACLALAALVASSVPATLAKERAYSSALPCPAMARPEDKNCLRLVPHTVLNTKIFDGRGAQYEARLASGSASPLTVRFSGDSPLLVRLHRGDPVTATVWRGRITSVTGRGVSQATPADPTGDYLYPIALSLLLTTVGAFGLWFVWWLLRHPGDYAAGRTRSVSVAGWVLAGVLSLIPLAALVGAFAGAPVWFQACMPAGFLALAWKWGRPWRSTARRAPRSERPDRQDPKETP